MKAARGENDQSEDSSQTVWEPKCEVPPGFHGRPQLWFCEGGRDKQESGCGPPGKGGLFAWSICFSVTEWKILEPSHPSFPRYQEEARSPGTPMLLHVFYLIVLFYYYVCVHGGGTHTVHTHNNFTESGLTLHIYMGEARLGQPLLCPWSHLADMLFML